MDAAQRRDSLGVNVHALHNNTAFETTVPDRHERVVNGFSDDGVMEEHRRRYEFACSYINGARVLDAAGGSGYGAAMLAEQGSQWIAALDFDFPSLRWGRLHHAHVRTHAVGGDCMHMPFARSTFDVVVSFETIEHLHNPADFLIEVHRVLVPNGLFIVSTPNPFTANFPGGWFSGRTPAPENPHHVREYDMMELRTLLQNLFRIESMHMQKALPRLRVSAIAAEMRLRPKQSPRLLERYHSVFAKADPRVLPYRSGAIPAFILIVARRHEIGT